MFYVQEFVLYLEEQPDHGKDEMSKQALVIGLGPGAAAQGLLKRGVQVDVVEWDAAVIASAHQHFGFKVASPHRVFNVDAFQLSKFPRHMPNWIDEVSGEKSSIQGASYDYILHDIFSGGSVVAQLYEQVPCVLVLGSAIRLVSPFVLLLLLIFLVLFLSLCRCSSKPCTTCSNHQGFSL